VVLNPESTGKNPIKINRIYVDRIARRHRYHLDFVGFAPARFDCGQEKDQAHQLTVKPQAAWNSDDGLRQEKLLVRASLKRNTIPPA
jgi:hypothetical protein